MLTSDYIPTIGLETHVQLSTQSKAFCADPNQFGDAPNRNVSVVSLGYPGTLPVLNEAQVRAAVKLGLALGCKINRQSTFDRKNYFYADLPKGYQITQDENPICNGGELPLRMRSGANATPRRVRIHHIHMEEDAGKSIHASGEDFTRVDLNRAGTPLLEIVTEPDLANADEVDAFMSSVRRLVRWLDISDGNMQEGSLRCDVNVSIRPTGTAELGTRCEIKNMNSMKFARQAVAHEIERQSELLDRGEAVRQQTRQFDPVTGTTAALRDKEDAHDYRYFPEPDLPPVSLDENYLRDVRAEIGVLPWQALAELQERFQLEYREAAALTEERSTYEAFLNYAVVSPDVPALAKIWLNRLGPWLAEEGISAHEIPLTPGQLAQIQEMIMAGDVASAAATGKLLPDLLNDPGNPQDRAERLGLIQNNNTDFLGELADQVIAENPDKVAAYRKGKKGLIGFFMGEVMKRSKGSAEPQAARKILTERL